MLNIGPQELLLILLVALLVVGPKRLPELSRTIGRGLREFRKAQDEVSKTIRLGLDESEPASRKPAGRPSAGATIETEEAGTPRPTEDQPPKDESADIARKLGRGLSEIRRARREIQQTFRVDLTDRAPRSRARPAAATSSSARPDVSAPRPQESEGASGSAPDPTPAGPPPTDPGDPAEPTEPA